MTKAKIIPLKTKPQPDLIGNTKATREDWLNTAMDILVTQGVEQVKVQPIGERLGVSRSSFYWYFKSRQDLLDALLVVWEETNTGAIVGQSLKPAKTITEAVCNLFRCFVDPDGFDYRLDFAIREWSRRSGSVRTRVDSSDKTRVAAIATMFSRYNYAGYDSEIRARILYYMQIGYYAADLQEPMEQRLDNIAGYLSGFTGQQPMPNEIEEFRAYTKAMMRKTKT